VEAPGRRGFGSRLIERSLASDLGGGARLQFHAAGVVCTIEAPFSAETG
jgi:two-component sensor histidine kinase